MGKIIEENAALKIENVSLKNSHGELLSKLNNVVRRLDKLEEDTHAEPSGNLNLVDVMKYPRQKVKPSALSIISSNFRIHGAMLTQEWTGTLRELITKINIAKRTLLSYIIWMAYLRKPIVWFSGNTY